MFWKLEKLKAALEVLDKFSEFGCTSDGDSYYLAIQAAGKKSMVGAAWGVCEKMISSGCFADGKKAGEIVTFFCKGKKVTEAHSVYLAVKEKKDCLKREKWRNAKDMIRVMERRGLRPHVYTYSMIMSGYAKGGMIDEAHYHILICGYCKMEEFEKAPECLKEMKEDGVQPNVDEYNKLIQSLCLKAMDWRIAEKLLEEMEGSGLYLKGITRSLIAAVKELEMEEMSKDSQEA
ncbi:hypothetical protein CFC21_066754 [Triticum aestivum]|uniref:Pentacotripeptide-repeat region of PRORP domain-containing protein n=2 Tax=Triticum aestivum TaxID=4565 RepID=A0A3B6KJY1_WHEAT|nr:hypothetical protein CFC21_066754 [Triticum aestivum]